MNSFKQIYSLKEDPSRIRMIQEASLDKKSLAGYKIEDGLLFGTKDWFDSVYSGKIPHYVIKGVISNLYLTGHNDYPEVEIENMDGKSRWTRYGSDSAYQIGKKIKLTIVEQKFKRPTDITGLISKCIIEIWISE